MPPTFVGIKNISGEESKVTYGGHTTKYAKDEVRVVDAAEADFLVKRTVYGSQKTKDGQVSTVKSLFELVPLAEALKVAKAPKNPSVEAARAAVKEEEALTARILEKLKKEGWKPPEAQKPSKSPKS